MLTKKISSTFTDQYYQDPVPNPNKDRESFVPTKEQYKGLLDLLKTTLKKKRIKEP